MARPRKHEDPIQYLAERFDDSENSLGSARRHDSQELAELEVGMSKQLSQLDFHDCLEKISAAGSDGASGGDDKFLGVPTDS